MSQVRSCGVHTATIAGELLGSDGEQMLGPIFLWVGAAGKSVHIDEDILSQSSVNAELIASPIPLTRLDTQSSKFSTSQGHYIPIIDHMYKGAVSENTRQANKIAGAVNSN